MLAKIKEFLAKHDSFFFAFRSKKVIIGGILFILIIFFGVMGPALAKYKAHDMPAYDQGLMNPQSPPSKAFPLGTNYFGEDLLSQLLIGMRSTIGVGLLGAVIGTIIGFAIGFFSGYYGGKAIDEILMIFTNILLVIPVLAILIILGCYLPQRDSLTQAIIIGCTGWPWVARAVRAQTLSIKNKDYVNIARISANSTPKIIVQDIAANMMSYCVMVFILQFQNAVLTSVGLDVIGLGPSNTISVGLIMYQANQQMAVQLGAWWWPFFPGLVVTFMIASLFLVNTGLLEVFNPKLREM